MTADDFNLMLDLTLSGHEIPVMTKMKLKLHLQNFASGHTDPWADVEEVLAVQTWAMNVAKDNGANTPRAAVSMIRGRDIADSEWSSLKDYWEFAWPHLGS